MDVEFLLLADYAESIGGKLYVTGGGWDTLTVPHLPFQRQCGLATGLRANPQDSQTRHSVSVAIVRKDTGAVLARFDGEIEATPLARNRSGRPELIALAFNVILVFESEADYLVQLRVDGEERTQLEFSVAIAS